MKIFNKIKILLLIFFSTILFSCNHHAEDKIIVVGVKQVNLKDYKYKYELDFFIRNQYLYSNEIYQIGDTLNLKCND